MCSPPIRRQTSEALPTALILTVCIFLSRYASYILRPEVFRAGLSASATEYDDKADVFSFGILMYALGARTAYPYEATYLTPPQVVNAVATRGLRPPISSGFGLEPPFISLMESCWSANPSDRPRMNKVAFTLHGMLEHRMKKNANHDAAGANHSWGSWFGF